MDVGWLTAQGEDEEECEVDVHHHLECDERQHSNLLHADNAHAFLVDVCDPPDEVHDDEDCVRQHHEEAVEQPQLGLHPWLQRAANDVGPLDKEVVDQNLSRHVAYETEQDTAFTDPARGVDA